MKSGNALRLVCALLALVVGAFLPMSPASTWANAARDSEVSGAPQVGPDNLGDARRAAGEAGQQAKVLKEGAGQLAAGIGEAQGQTQQLIDALTAAQTGSQQLSDGMVQLQAGTGQLGAGATQLADSIGEVVGQVSGFEAVRGQVVGVNSAIATTGSGFGGERGNIGVGFAIPIDHAERIAQEIIDTGEATHGYLGAGVSAAAADDGESRTFSEGALVRSVEDGSPADDAGLQEGDIIRSFNGHTTLDADELTAAVREVPAGGKGELVYERDGQEKTVEVTVGNAADAD